MTATWNFADVWESVARTIPDRIAQSHGDRQITWGRFNTIADRLAAALGRSGLPRQAKVALYQHNGPEYLQSAFACFKAGLVPVNTNYRYQADELLYLWHNADAEAVIFDAAFTGTIDAIRDRCPGVRCWIRIDAPGTVCPDWASRFEALTADRHEPPAPSMSDEDPPSRAESRHGSLPRPSTRSGEDLLIIYTGGTTGRPRGVMWRQHDLYVAANAAGDPEQADLNHVVTRISAAVGKGRTPVGLPAAPLMHGTAFVFAATILNRGGTVVTLPGGRFDAAATLDAIESSAVTDLCIVGDAFCRPLVDQLEASPQRWNIRRLRVVSSSGMVWSESNKRRLLAHAPDAMLLDFLNSSEASGMGRTVATRERIDPGTQFRLGENAFVIDEHNRPLAPGCGIPGRVAVRAHVPLGYYGDPVKSAQTFPVIEGVRCAVPGDYALALADGTIQLLGRGSACINTGGEKVFPEEVEECIRQLEQVADVAVVGIPDAQYGERVAAVVQVSAGTAPIDPDALIAHVRNKLARHKAPRVVMFTDSVGRGPNGKADYRALKARVSRWLSEPSSESSPPT